MVKAASAMLAPPRSMQKSYAHPLFQAVFPRANPQPCTSFANKVFQDAHLLVCAQLDPVVGSKDPSMVPVAMPVAGQEPVACFARMALARPVDEPLLHQIIVPAHGCCWDDSGIVGCPPANQGIE